MTDNTQEQSAKTAYCSEPDYTHPDEMPIVEHSPNPYSDLRGTIVHFTSEMLDNPDDNGIYPTTNFYSDLEQAIIDWHNKQTLELLDRLFDIANNKMYPNGIEDNIEAERNKLKESHNG